MMDRVLKNVMKTTKSYGNYFKKKILEINKTKDYNKLILLMNKNMQEFYCHLNLGLEQKDLEKKYFYLAILTYGIYNIFIYIKEHHITDLILSKKHAKYLSKISNTYISPLTFVNYMCFNTPNRKMQKEFYNNFLATEEFYVSPKKINLNLKFKIENKDFYSIYVFMDRVQNSLYRIHELILSPELDKLEIILNKKYKTNTVELNQLMVKKYDLERFRCK